MILSGPYQQIPSAWNMWRESAVFGNSNWAEVLACGLGARTHWFADEAAADAIPVQEFRRGPFRIAYVNFPVGGTLRQQPVGLERLIELRAAIARLGVQRLRLCASPFRGEESIPNETAESLPETCIVTLQNYNPNALARVRRDLARAQRFGVEIGVALDSIDSRLLFNWYSATVHRHGGTPRYTQAYFDALLSLANRHDGLHVLMAQRQVNPCGFLVLVTDPPNAWYLHGAVAPDQRRYGVSDVLVDAAIRMALEVGCQRFNLMASPLGQQNLVRFKEKWGAETHLQHNYDWPLHYGWNLAFSLARQLASLHRFRRRP